MATTPLPTSGIIPTQAIYDNPMDYPTVVIAKANEANLAAANDPTGRNEFISEVFNAVTLSTGKVTVTGTNVAGTGTNFGEIGGVQVGNYLYYYDGTGTPVVFGKVSSITSATGLTLTAAAPSNLTDVFYGYSNVSAGTFDNFLVRVNVQPGITVANSILIPWVAGMRQSQGYADSQFAKLLQKSITNAPLLPDNSGFLTPLVIEGIAPWPLFLARNNTPAFFQTTAAFPKYAYFTANPWGDADVGISANTMYEIFVQQRLLLAAQVQVGVLAVGANSIQASGYRVNV